MSKAALFADVIPAALKSRDQWVTWRWQPRPDKPSEMTKVPYTVDGRRRAEADDPTTWGGYSEAQRKYDGGQVDGIGFEVSDADPYTAVDLDHCVSADGVVADWAQEIVLLLDSYSEVTPSGSGLRVWVEASIPADLLNGNQQGRRKGSIEVYQGRHFLTVTGDRVEQLPATIEKRQEPLTTLCYETFGKPGPKVDKGSVAASPAGGRTAYEVLDLARQHGNWAKWDALMRGDTSEYDSQSEADAGLCALAAFYTRDPAVIDQIVKMSGLYRSKWEREDYRERTIARALEVVKDTYEPGAQAERRREGAPDPQPRAQDTQSPAEQEWEEPIPLSREVDLPEFPIKVYPDWLQRFVGALARETQTPVELAGMMVLAALSTCSGGRVRVQVRPGWEEPLSTYGATVLPPGERKTAVVKAVMAPLVAFEAEVVEEEKFHLAEEKARREIAEKALQATKEKAAKTGKQEDLEAALKAMRKLLEMPELRKPFLMLADDSTPEALTSLLAEQDGRMSILSDEGGVFDLMAGRYQQQAGRSLNLDIYLKGHSESEHRVNRKGRPPEYIPRPSLTIGLTVQPDVLHSLADRPGFRGRGLLARFMYNVPLSLVGRRSVGADPISGNVRGTYSTKIKALAKRLRGLSRQPLLLEFDQEANSLMLAFETELEPRLGEDGDLEHIRDWAGKLAGLGARIAANLELAGAGEAAELVSAKAAKAGIQFAKYLLPHALAAFDRMGADKELASARRVLRWVAKQDLPSFSQRDCFDAVRTTQLSRMEALIPILTLLESHGYIRRQESPTADRPKRGRPLGPRFKVNPLLKWKPTPQNPQNPQNSEEGVGVADDLELGGGNFAGFAGFAGRNLDLTFGDEADQTLSPDDSCPKGGEHVWQNVAAGQVPKCLRCGQVEEAAPDIPAVDPEEIPF